LKIEDDTEKCFLSQKGSVYSIQRINSIFKDIKKNYNLKIQNFSTHTMRKTFGRKVFESAGENANLALVRLSELFNHSNIAITKIYLGIRQEELLETYDLLDF
jgi:site-specific recombinase XerD